MASTTSTFDFIQTKVIFMKHVNLQWNSPEVIDDASSYVNAFRLYYAYFKAIPTVKTIYRLDLIKVRHWLDQQHGNNIVVKHSSQKYNWEKKKLGYLQAFYLLDNDLLLHLEDQKVTILHNYSQELIAKIFLLDLKQFMKRERTTQEISLVINTSRGLDTTDLKVRKPKLQLADNYNDDLTVLHEKIVTTLRQKNKSGIYLFHGVPGTGKSTYIRYLIRCINKKVIFIPPGLAANLDAPNLTQLLIENANTVFVIEDAEQLITSRDAGRNSSISVLLNLTDGLLGESLGIQVIATFNTELKNIDKALLRKGRLLALYDFKQLSIEKSRRLLEKLGTNDYFVRQPLTLAEIYNIQDETFHMNGNDRQAIGFMAKAV